MVHGACLTLSKCRRVSTATGAMERGDHFGVHVVPVRTRFGSTALGKLNLNHTTWILYDVGSWAFCSLTFSTYLPMYWHHFVNRKGHADHVATVMWGYGLSLALFISAILSPFVGQIADRRHARKAILLSFVVMSAACAALFCFVPEGDPLIAMFAVVLANVGYTMSLVSIRNVHSDNDNVPWATHR